MAQMVVIFLFFITLSNAALIPHPHRLHQLIRQDNEFERNCFFSPAQCLLGNFPKSSNLQPVLRVFEETSLDTIYSKLLITSNRPAFFGSRK
ncbi:Protein CBG22712 [Caenorhabditis briggsae]|uniref:Protein CBG22712 n=1 Tax=Caenorhabditis briggsae TaxID=6238 RepID=A8Y303_CAEBR|nr:Protein CBG22712 [Caenorhabditis briggsae]CAP39242.1 Protein CBG22712 [Caenorhabditis briggsae]